jgi:hypothetical protein
MKKRSLRIVLRLLYTSSSNHNVIGKPYDHKKQMRPHRENEQEKHERNPTPEELTGRKSMTLRIPPSQRWSMKDYIAGNLGLAAAAGSGEDDDVVLGG